MKYVDSRITAVKETVTPLSAARGPYGAKIACSYMVQLDGEKRWHRVYAVNYGNNASLYVLVRGGREFINCLKLDR